MTRIVFVVAVAMLALSCKTREERLNAAEEKGKEVVEVKARIAKGAGEALQGEGKNAAEELAAGAGQLVKGVGKGFEKGTALRLAVSADLGTKGVEATRASRESKSDKPDQKIVTVYVVLKGPFTGSLELLALDSEKKEVGRASAKLAEAAATAKYVDFAFDARTPLEAVENLELR
jgi:hypothetical protein